MTVPAYYNTNHESGKVLKASQIKAHTQQQKILEFFQENPELSWSREEINNLFPAWPYTSVQRCLTNLTKLGKLKKLDQMVEGKYGKQVHTWTLAQQDN